MPNPPPSMWCGAFAHNFPNLPAASEEELSYQQRALRPIKNVTIRHRRLPPLKVATPQPSSATAPTGANACRLRHEGLVSESVMRTQARLAPREGWDMIQVREHERIVLPKLNCHVDNSDLLLQLCTLLIQKSMHLVRRPPTMSVPSFVELALFVFADGYSPRGRPNVNIEVALVDLQGTLFPSKTQLPSCTTLLTWRELPKNEFGMWVSGRVEEINNVQRQQLRMGVFHNGKKTVVCISIKFKFLAADHHQLWWECGQKGCVMCSRDRNNPVASLFASPPQPLTFCKHGKLLGVGGLHEAYARQPQLHNLKGSASRGIGVIGRALKSDERHTLLLHVATVARRYTPSDLPPNSRASILEVKRRFQQGMSFTGREARVDV